MVPRSPRERLRDIATAIEKIERFLAGKNFEDFSSDALVHDAVVRNLEVISEASRHLGEDLKRTASEIPWRSVGDMGNWLRHGYDAVSDRILWDAIERDLPVLRSAIRRLLSVIDS